VGFSGGNKYFFPGCSVHDVIDISHWVGALITASRIIGTLGITPVRQLIDAASDLIDTEKYAFTMDVISGGQDLNAVAFGDPQAAWAAMAKISAQTHITYVERPFKRIVALVPEMYDDMWTGDRKSTRLNSSHVSISYAVFCLKKKKTKVTTLQITLR